MPAFLPPQPTGADKRRKPAVFESLHRIADALERLAPRPPGGITLCDSPCQIWEPGENGFRAARRVDAPSLKLLLGIPTQKSRLLNNTRQFAEGHPANNALLWGARGMGKSSLVKAVHAHLSDSGIRLMEIYRDDLASLPRIFGTLRHRKERFIVFFDDLSFDRETDRFNSLKTALDGGIEGRPANVLVYATSNRRHLMDRDAGENDLPAVLHPGEGADASISLADRFGLWLGFHTCSQTQFQDMVRAYASHYGLETSGEDLDSEALAWAALKGARSGRIAWQFIQDLRGREAVGPPGAEPEG